MLIKFYKQYMYLDIIVVIFVVIFQLYYRHLLTLFGELLLYFWDFHHYFHFHLNYFEVRYQDSLYCKIEYRLFNCYLAILLHVLFCVSFWYYYFILLLVFCIEFLVLFFALVLCSPSHYSTIVTTKYAIKRTKNNKKIQD